MIAFLISIIIIEFIIILLGYRALLEVKLEYEELFINYSMLAKSYIRKCDAEEG